MNKNTTHFPETLKNSATPRWSHRDPVERGNPFPVNDSRYRKWELATREANAVLVEQDRLFSNLKSNVTSYPKDVIKFATTRFDVWAKRCLSIVCNPSAARNYEQWLNTYVERWLLYTSQTCPQIDIQKALERTLRIRVSYWTTQARDVTNHNHQR